MTIEEKIAIATRELARAQEVLEKDSQDIVNDTKFRQDRNDHDAGFALKLAARTLERQKNVEYRTAVLNALK